MSVTEDIPYEGAGIQEGGEDTGVRTNLEFGGSCSLVEGLISKI